MTRAERNQRFEKTLDDRLHEYLIKVGKGRGRSQKSVNGQGKVKTTEAICI